MRTRREFKVCGTQTRPTLAWQFSQEGVIPIARISSNDSLSPYSNNQQYALNNGKADLQVIQKPYLGWREFFGLSTCAAVVHFGNFDRQPLLVRFIWVVNIIAGVLFFTSSTYSSAVSFFKASASSEMVIEKVQGSRLEFPKFHICTTNTFNTTVLAGWELGDSQMVSYLQLASSGMAVSPTLIANQSLQNALASRLEKALSVHNITIKQVFTQSVLKCEEIVSGCMMPGLMLDGAECCARFFGSSSFPAITGACVTTRSTFLHSQPMTSFAFGFVVIIRTTRPTFALDHSLIHPVFGGQRGVFFSVSDKWTNPYVSIVSGRQYVRAGLVTSLAIKKEIINDEAVKHSLVSRKQCALQEEESFRSLVSENEFYTQTNCFYTMRQNKIEKLFNCSVLGLPSSGHHDHCKPQVFIEFSKRVYSLDAYESEEVRRFLYGDGECVSECVREVYSISASSADYAPGQNFEFGNWTINPNESAELAGLHFYYPSFTYTHLVNHYPTLHEFLGILGGNLGLFLGASMVTIVEAFIFCFYCCRIPRVLNE